MLKYLFFDIECSNCFGRNPKMCEFGYVLTDENFKVIRSDSIPMSPGRKNHENRFDLTIYKRDPEFQWAYDIDYYFECPEFPEYYELISRLFKTENVVIFGYSVDNDIRYLDNAFKRYKLNPVEYEVYDIQRMMKYYSEKKERFMGLEDAFKKLCSINEFIKLQKHLSRDDAFMAMRVLQKMCENLEVTPLEMIELCDNCKYDSKEYLTKYNKNQYYKKEKEIGQTMWENFYRECTPMLENDESIGKIITISGKIKDNPIVLQELIKLIKDNGFIGFDKISGSDYLISLNNEDSIRIKNALKHPYHGKIITIQEFQNLEVKI